MSEIIIPAEESKPNYITIKELDGRPNVILSVIVHPDTKDMQVIINSNDELRLWATFHRIEDSIRYVLQQAAMKRQAMAIQPVPASVLERLNA